MMVFEIGELHPNTPHLFADLVELWLLVGGMGRDSLHANDLEALLNQKSINSDEVDDEDKENAAQKSSAERNSRGDRQIEDVLGQLTYRAASFGDWYPFSMKGEVLQLHHTFSEHQRLYRVLLACSRLRSFKYKGIPQRWAKTFTHVAHVAMMGLAPSAACSRIFDANSDDRKNYYGTDLRKALPILGRDLGVLKVNEEECNKASSSGDAGYDLITTLGFDDGAATSFVLLGQCGAQETEWPKKTLEAHAINCRNYFQMQLDHPSVMFTPISYRMATGEWVDNKCANGILLVDRLRILKLLAIPYRLDQIINSFWFLNFEEEFLKFEV